MTTGSAGPDWLMSHSETVFDFSHAARTALTISGPVAAGEA